MSRLNHSGADVENSDLIIQGYEPQNDESTRFSAGQSGLVVLGGEGEEHQKASSSQVRSERREHS